MYNLHHINVMFLKVPENRPTKLARPVKSPTVTNSFCEDYPEWNVNFVIFYPIGLSLDQVDTLWACLAKDTECSDEALSWFLNQAGNKDQHALGLETFKHIFFNKVSLLNQLLIQYLARLWGTSCMLVMFQNEV